MGVKFYRVDSIGWFPSLTRAYGDNGRRPRHKLIRLSDSDSFMSKQSALTAIAQVAYIGLCTDIPKLDRKTK